MEVIHAYPEDGETVDSLGKTEISNFDSRWNIFREEDVLHRQSLTAGDHKKYIKNGPPASDPDASRLCCECTR